MRNPALPWRRLCPFAVHAGIAVYLDVCEIIIGDNVLVAGNSCRVLRKINDQNILGEGKRKILSENRAAVICGCLLTDRGEV